jgi:ribosomal protein S18 acetylase RimI-like enzyme
VGFACYGRIPAEPANHDLYWLIVHPEHQREGVGRRLMEQVEAAIRLDHGRRLMIETSSRDDYAPARAFYLRLGCRELHRVKDFYAPGEDKGQYVKALSPA